ncbi:MAG: Gfo/Idh/MocA family oxidoreductase [Verrucomicrobiales bacterium]|nr:Gfo/Idh/MocA family oxidoreductase [Verrucomicrobiales bacterium]
MHHPSPEAALPQSDLAQTSRRGFLKQAGAATAVSALAGVKLPYVHAADDSTVSVALIGCGGRGSGAAVNALSVKQGPVRLVAMADVFENRLDGSYQALKRSGVSSKVEVADDKKFIGFEAYKQAMDCLRPGDVAVFATPLAFRWVHFQYAIQKGLNVFMEKPVTADGPSSRRMLKLAEEATAKNLKVGVGLMSRHNRGMQELAKRIQDGEIGDINFLRGYRMHGPVGSAFTTKWDGKGSELMYQIRRFHSFLWASGGCFSDFYIHIIDHLCWMKGSWPVKAQALGGRHYKTDADGNPYVDQNFDSYSVEYTFADGAKMLFGGRCVDGAVPIYSSYAHGSKGMAVVSKANDCGLPSSIHKGQTPDRGNRSWVSEVPGDEQDPYTNEWNDLMDAIRNDKPYNEAKRGVEASLVTSLGRMAAHTGQEVTYDELLNSTHEFAPDADKFTPDSPAPVTMGADGRYPIPEPGRKKEREY